MRKWIANMISLSRLAIIVPWALCIGPRPLLAFLFICIVIATDLLDGPLARRLATTATWERASTPIATWPSA